MTQESAPQGEAERKRDFQWGVLLGLLLAALNAQVLYLEFYSRDLGLFGRQSKTVLIFQYLLLCFLLFLFVGLLNGYITGQVRPIRRISMTAGLIGFISGIVLTFVLSVLGGLEGLYLLLTGEGIIVDLLLPVLCVGGGISGGLMGSRVLRPAALRGGRSVLRLVLVGLVIVELASITSGGLGFVGKGPLAFLGTPFKEFSVPTPRAAHQGLPPEEMVISGLLSPGRIRSGASRRAAPSPSFGCLRPKAASQKSLPGRMAISGLLKQTQTRLGASHRAE